MSKLQNDSWEIQRWPLSNNLTHNLSYIFSEKYENNRSGCGCKSHILDTDACLDIKRLFVENTRKWKIYAQRSNTSCPPTLYTNTFMNRCPHTFTLKHKISDLVLSSSGPGPRSGPGQVPGQVQKVQGPRTKRPGPGLTLNLVCHPLTTHHSPPPLNFSCTEHHSKPLLNDF